jgi:hypothetical protein
MAKTSNNTQPSAIPAEYDLSEFSEDIPAEYDLSEFSEDIPEEYDLSEFNVDEPKPKQGFFETTAVTNDQMNSMAVKYGVPIESVRRFVDLYGGLRDAGMDEVDTEWGAKTISNYLKSLAYTGAGVANEVALGMPMWAYRKLVETGGNENLARLMSDVQKLTTENKSKGQMVAEGLVSMAVPVGLPAKATAKAAGATKSFLQAAKQGFVRGAAEGAVVGGAYGLGHSDIDQELKNTVSGATMGAGFGGLFMGAVGGASQALMNRSARMANPKDVANINNKAMEAMERAAKSEDKLTEVMSDVISNVSKLDDASAFKSYGRDLLDGLYGKIKTTARLKSLAKKRGRDVASPDDVAELTQMALRNEVLHIAKVTKRLRKRKGKLTWDRAKDFVGENLEHGLGADGMLKVFQQKRLNQYRMAALKQEMPVVSKNVANVFDKWIDRMLDSQFVMSRIDNKYGSDLEPLLGSLIQRHNQYTVIESQLANRLNNLKTQAKKANLTNEQVERYLNTGDATGLAENQLVIAQQYREHLNDIRKIANDDLGMTIAERENFFPHMVVETKDYIARMQHMESQIPKLENLSSEQFSKVLKTNKKVQDYIHGLEIMTGMSAKSRNSFLLAKSASRSPKTVHDSLSRLARTSHAREGTIPQFLRETDLQNAITRYQVNTLRTGTIKPDLDKIAAWLEIFDKAGDTVTADYIRRFVSDAYGQYAGGLYELGRAASTKFSSHMKRKALQAKDAGSLNVAGMYDALADSPNMFNFITKQMYPNVMGFKARPVLRNLTQPFLMTATEIGEGGYGQKLVLGALFDDTLKAFRKGTVTKEIRELGLSPAAWKGEVPVSLSDSIGNNTLSQAASKLNWGVEKVNNLGMLAYTGSDAINRHVTYNAGKRLARDFFKGNPKAKTFVNKMSKGYRDKLKNATQEEAERLIGSYLVSRTQFNYNRLAMSEFGRMMGPVFSVFTKWPTAIAGDMVDKIRREGLSQGGMKIATKYFGPLATLTLLDTAFEDVTESDDPFLNQIFYKEGLSAIAPVHSVKALSPAELSRPPLIEVTSKVFNQLASDRPVTLDKMFDRALDVYTPGHGLYRFMSSDLPALLEPLTD